MLRVPLSGLLTQKSTASSTPLTLKKRAAAIASAADEKAGVIIRHREEWGTQRALVTTAIEKNDFDKAKLAKITAETLKIRPWRPNARRGASATWTRSRTAAWLTVRILRVSGE